jgi:hypothetical protein
MNDQQSWRSRRVFLSLVSVFLFILNLSSCRSPFVEAEIQNHTNAPLQLIEVDYPSASFGIGSLAPNATFRYRFKILGSGNVQLNYSDPSGKPHRFRGPELKEGQQGSLIVTIDGTDSVHWTPALSEKR